MKNLNIELFQCLKGVVLFRLLSIPSQRQSLNQTPNLHFHRPWHFQKEPSRANRILKEKSNLIIPNHSHKHHGSSNPFPCHPHLSKAFAVSSVLVFSHHTPKLPNLPRLKSLFSETHTLSTGFSLNSFPFGHNSVGLRSPRIQIQIWLQ